MEINTLADIKPLEQVVRQSCIKDCLSCQRYCMFKDLWGLVPRIENYTPAPRQGRIFHRLLQLGPDGIETVKQEIIEAQTLLMNQVEAGGDLTGELARTAQGLTDLYNKTLTMAQIFWKKFPLPDYLKVIERELKIRITHPLIPLPVEGTIDCLMQDTRDGKFWIRDAKTDSQQAPIATYLSGASWGVQPRTYRLVVETDRKIVVAGFIFDVAKVPGIKMCGTDEKNSKIWKCTVLEAYMRRVETWYLEKGEEAMASKGIIFNEPVLNREFLEDIAKTCNLLGRNPHNPEEFSRDETGQHCRHFNRTCNYLKLCETDVNGWPSIINQFYTQASAEEQRGETVEAEETE